MTWLGLIGSGLAFLAFFRLLGRWGAARTSMVAYLLPVWGIILGALVLREEIPPALHYRHCADHRRHRAGQRQAGIDRVSLDMA